MIQLLDKFCLIGGCIGGAGCLTHSAKNKAEVDKYGREALEKNISDAISVADHKSEEYNNSFILKPIALGKEDTRSVQKADTQDKRAQENDESNDYQ